ncbi:MAG: histidine phosphatase family protein [Alphaproteobacteria bacterium]|nr:histidine phosphatase family protein [Alphaproteobacteria bacterium]
MIPYKPFYFMRHGQTDYNKENRCMGSLDIPLNSIGEQQAYDARESLKGLLIDRVVSSPLQRAYTTARIIADHHAVPLDSSALLAEANWGEMQGKPITDPTFFTQWQEGLVLNGGESFESVKRRVKAALIEYLATDTTPLIISHGGVYWALLELLNLPYYDFHNCQIVYFTPTNTNSGPWLSKVL